MIKEMSFPPAEEEAVTTSAIAAILGTAVNWVKTPLLVTITAIVLLALFGKSLGVRRLYVGVLLRVFEFATAVAKEAKDDRKRNNPAANFQPGQAFFEFDDGLSSSEGEENDEGDDEISARLEAEGRDTFSDNTKAPKFDEAEVTRRRLQRSKKESKHNVISKKDNLILTPDQPPTLGLDDKSSEQNKPLTKMGVPERLLSGREVSLSTFQREFELHDILVYVKTGIGSIIEDEVTQRFVAEELKSWNLLTRTSQSFEFVNLKLTLIWVAGFVFRYIVLLPGRILIFLVALMLLYLGMVFLAYLPEGNMKKSIYRYVFTTCFQVLGGSLSAVINFHERENIPKNGICVANHTSPLDAVILACDNPYDLIGQRHGGFFGLLENILSKSSNHIWFDRTEANDRALVVKRLKEHVEDSSLFPVLLFPEGTCVNNTSVMQFKKGSFEVSEEIYPVAIKYDPRFGDAFWNSSTDGLLSYVYKMMTSWAIVCDVWYLPPMRRQEGENSVQFSKRVKAEIARRGGLVDLVWDGNLKRSTVRSEWKAQQQEAFSQRLKKLE